MHLRKLFQNVIGLLLLVATGAAAAPQGYGFTSVAAGNRHYLAIREDSTLWAWGGNTHGQLGNGTTSTVSQNDPVQIGVDQKWSTVSAGANY